VAVQRCDGIEVPRKFCHYVVTVKDQKHLPEGVTLTRLVG